MLGLVILLGVGLVIAWFAGVIWTIRLLTHPPRRTFAWAVSKGLPSDPSEADPSREFDAFTFRTPDGRGEFAAWSIAGEDPTGPIAIFTHGWGESRQAVIPRLDALAPVCSRIFAWDLPGHGESSGACHLGARESRPLHTLIGLALGAGDLPRDRSEPSVTSARNRAVVLVGFSLGAGVSLDVARNGDRRVVGVIAEAPYRLPVTPARNVLSMRRLPHRATLRPAVAWLGLRFVRDPRWPGFDRAEIAAGIRCPVLVLHGDADAVCPSRDGADIARAAPGGALASISQGAHTSLWTEDTTRRAAIEATTEFLRRVSRSTPVAR
ncbi:MAG: alpha/beta hydrolase [Phycisphaeraceae bacterium]|nr:alpha/beta hydrolase [Phycisphaeraceae bacterium]